MPDIVSDIVDVYVFRRQNARVQFLLLQRKASVPLGNTWQSFHTQIQGHETTVGAARRAVRELSGLNVSEAYSADYINEFFDDTRDVVVLAPVLAVNVNPQAPVTLGHELRDCAWWDTNQAIARLPFSGQRWAVRHISELMSAGHAESQLYRLQLPEESTPHVRRAPAPASFTRTVHQPVDDDPDSPAAASEESEEFESADGIDFFSNQSDDAPDSTSPDLGEESCETNGDTPSRYRTDVP
jgi:dATP pyrophosphohydrolase